ncbi:hypothetical protein WDU94_005863, partial [Cyamophila willieti]
KYLYGSNPYQLSSQPRTSLKYKLVSAVIHHGSSPDSGHYTCIGSTSSGVYHYFDDEMVRASNLNQLTNAYVVFYELLPSSAQHMNSLHSSSPGLASTNSSSSSTSTSSPSPRKLIGPQLPPNHLNKTSSSNHVLSSAVTTNIDVDKLTNSGSSSSNGGKFNNNTKPALTRPTVPPPLPPSNKSSPLSNGARPSLTSSSKLVLNSHNGVGGGQSSSKLVPNGGLLGSKLVQNGGATSPLCAPTKLPSPSFLNEKVTNGGQSGSTSTSGGSGKSNGEKLSTSNGGTSPMKPAGVTGKHHSNSVEDGGLKKLTANGAAAGGSVRSSPAKTNGRDSPSNSRTGLKRTFSSPAKLVDYESDDESGPDDNTSSGPGTPHDRKT